MADTMHSNAAAEQQQQQQQQQHSPGPSQRHSGMAANPAANESSSSLSSLASSSNANQVQQIGSRQGTRSRSRTTRKNPAAAAQAAAAAVAAAAASSHHNLPQGASLQPPNAGPSSASASVPASTHLPPSSHNKPSTSSNAPRHPPMPRYNSEDHPLSAHKLAAKGYHSFSCLGVPFHVPKKYTFVRELGIGAYGCVALARDEEADMNVAIKKVTRVFERDVLARRALREVAILRHMLKNQNCTALIDFDTTFIDFSEIYLVLSASEADLSQIIRSGQALSDAHLQYFAAQLLRGVRYMHAANIVHRDLKPGNLLVNADCALFICDFGLARAFAGPSTSSEEQQEEAHQDGDSNATGAAPQADTDDTRGRPARTSSEDAPGRPSKIRTSRLEFPGGPVTEYVSTRWYRAPEIMLGFRDGYGTEIDMWSVGCILAELAAGGPLFGGKDYVDQIARIHAVLGAPDQQLLDSISSERARVYVDSLPKTAPSDMGKILPGASPGLLDLLQKLLVWDPKERLSAADALQHPWLSAYHGIIDQWERPEPFNKFDEVELISTLPEFKAALQRESREAKGEYNSLFGSASEEDDDDDDEGTGSGEQNEEETDAARTSSGSADDADAEAEADENDGGEVTDEQQQRPQQTLEPAAKSQPQDVPEGGERRGSSSEFVRGSPASNGSANGSGLCRISECSSSSTSCDSASYSHHYTTDTGAASSSPMTSAAGSSAAVSAASSSAGDLASLTSSTIGREARSGSKSGGGASMGRHSFPAVVPLARANRSADAEDDNDDDTLRLGKEDVAVVSPTSSALLDHQVASKARYRRRAISNAPRYEGDQEQVTLDLERVPSTIAASGEDGPAAITLPDGRVSPPCPKSKLAPSPDFKSYTTDLIARPRSEVGAFSSPSLDAGDAFSTCVAVVTSPRSNPTSRRGSHSSSSAHHQHESPSSPLTPLNSGTGTRRRSKAEEMTGLISAIRAEAEKLKLSRMSDDNPKEGDKSAV